MKDKIKHTTEQIISKSGSKTFCPLPWIHMATRPNGDARLCCTANASGASNNEMTAGLIATDKHNFLNYGKQSIGEIFNSNFMKNVRLSMQQGIIPKSCTKCFEEEKNGVVSKRLWESDHWLKKGLDFNELIQSTKHDGSVPFKLRYLDLRLGNTCNLACAMCSPHDSSRWVNDNKKLLKKVDSEEIKSQIIFNSSEYNFSWYNRPEFWKDLNSQIENISEIYFAGGEPLAIKEHDKFIDELIASGNSNEISLRYNSNGLLIDNLLIAKWEKFKNVKFSVSIDAFDDKNYYIRYPTDWKHLNYVLERLDQTSEKIQVSIEATAQALNILYLPELVKWKLSKNFKKINSHYIEGYQAGGGLLNVHLLYLPSFLSASVLPLEVKEKINDVYSDFRSWLWNNYTQDDMFWKNNPYGWKRWNAILKQINSNNHSEKYELMKQYYDNLDIIRNSNWRTTFPDLE